MKRKTVYKMPGIQGFRRVKISAFPVHGILECYPEKIG
ncbi:hypothetical protein BMS3Abin07_00667 [bacterium BMS3Abin07]|nr:hypothetical protein BMS3Abin07_00667 [bacterium BMS3Abin07]GBE32904.1 hypothetical protein BMS3Bbin05_01832 [bacterium BMS3Bbin05]